MTTSASPAIGSRQWWKHPLREPAPRDPDQATARTVEIMCGLVANPQDQRIINKAAQDAVRRFLSFAGGASRAGVAGACWWWCKTFLTFEHHEFIIRANLGEYGHLQGLIAPDALLQLRQYKGDCAIYTMLLCAMLRALGVPCEIVTVAVNRQEPSIFSHVYLYAVLENGERLPLDASHGDYPGWEVPSRDVFRRQVWDASARPVADQRSRFDGLHHYSMRGLGDDGATDPGTFTSFPTDNYTPSTDFVAPAITPEPVTTPGSGINWGSILGSELSQWTKIAGNVIAPQQTIMRGPNGQLYISGPASSSTAGASSLLTAATSSSIVPWLLGGGVLLLLVVGLGKR